MDLQSENDIPYYSRSFASSILNINPTRYGEGMTVTGNPNPNRQWSSRNGVNNMKYIHADSETNFTVKGELPMSSLVPRRKYKGVFELELTSQASGWQGDFKVSLEVPGSLRAVERSYKLKHDTVGAFELKSKSFKLDTPQKDASLRFSLSHTGPYIRKGLIVKCFVIRDGALCKKVERLLHCPVSELLVKWGLKFALIQANPEQGHEEDGSS